MITGEQIMDCKLGHRPDLTLVYLFKSTDLPYGPAVWLRVNNAKAWCEGNIGLENSKWAFDGFSSYSYQIIFADPADAVAFKLVFGL